MGVGKVDEIDLSNIVDNMNSITYSHARENLAHTITFVCENHDPVIITQKVNVIIKDIDRNQYKGLGKPEPLKHALSGFWSRRISEEHRLIYRIVDDEIHIAQLRYHY